MVSWSYENRRWLILTILLLQVLCTSADEKACSQSLGMQNGRITDDMIRVSSTKEGSNKTYARYGCCADTDDGAFCPDKRENHTWIEIDFGAPTAISGIRMQLPSRKVTPTDYLKTFHMLYRPQGRPHLEYLANEGGPLVLTAYDQRKHVEMGTTLQPFVTDQIRIEVESYNMEPCFRFELFGCSPEGLCPDGCDNGGSCAGVNRCACPPNFQGRWCEQPIVPAGECTSPIGMESGKINDTQLTVSSSAAGKGKEKARWNCCKGEHLGAWCPADSDKSPYFQVTFDKPVSIGAIGMELPARHSLSETETTYMKTYDVTFQPEGSSGSIATYTNITAAFNATTGLVMSFPPIRTDVLKIIPKTYEKKPCFRFELYACDPNAKCPLGCKNGGTCKGPNHCACAAGFAGESCQYTGITIELQLQIKFTFELIIGTTLVTPTRNLTLHGNPKLIDGRFGKALFLNGNGQYVEIQKKDLGCMANVDRCRSGFTLSMDVNFISIREGMYLFSSGGDSASSTGVSCHVQKSNFVVTVRTSTQIWEGKFHIGTIKIRTWTKMEFSWSLREGLLVYAAGKQVLRVPTPTTTRPKPVYESHNLRLGSTPITITNKVNAEFIIENYQTWFVSKKAIADTRAVNDKCPDECMNNGTCTDEGICKCLEGYEGHVCQFRKNSLQHYNLTFVKETTTTVNGEWMVFGGPKFHTGPNSEVSIGITNTTHYLELKPAIESPCLGNINLCFTGFTYHLDLKVTKWVENTYIISSCDEHSKSYGISFFYASESLIVHISTSVRVWQVKLSYIPAVKKWHSIEFSWIQSTGLVVYIDNTIVGSDIHPVTVQTPTNETYPIRIGAPVKEIAGRENPHFEVSSIQVWFATRNVLEGFHYLPEASTIPPTTPTVPTTQIAKGPLTDKAKTTVLRVERTREHTVTGEKQTSTMQPETKMVQPRTTEVKQQTTVMQPHTAVGETTAEKPGTTAAQPETTFVQPQTTVQRLKTHYNLTFLDVHTESNIVTTGQWVVFGNPKHEKQPSGEITFEITNTKQYLILKPSMSSPCLDNVNSCSTGLTFHIDLKVHEWVANTYILSSERIHHGSHGITLAYGIETLLVYVSTTSQHWDVDLKSLPKVDTWHSIELSWSVSMGLKVYIDNVIVGTDSIPAANELPMNITYPIHIGAPVEMIPNRKNPNFTIANVQMWSAVRNILVGKGVLPELTLDTKIKQDLVVGVEAHVTLIGEPTIVAMRQTQQHAIMFQQKTPQFLDLSTPNRTCFNDISLCKSGLTVSFKVKFISLKENTFILSNGAENPHATGVVVVYRFGRLQFVFSHQDKAWYCSIPRPPLDSWVTVDFTWDVKTGLEVYVDNRLQDKSIAPIPHQATSISPTTGHFYFGSSSTKVQYQQNFNGYLASVSTWFTSRIDLVKQGKLPAAITTPAPTTAAKLTQQPTTTTTSTMAPTTTTTAKPITPKPTTPKPATPKPTTPGELTCPTGCVKEGEVQTGTPPTPTQPELSIRASTDASESYFVCKFNRAETTNLLHVVGWKVNGVEVHKESLPGTSGEAILKSTDLEHTVLGKQICCTVKNEFTGVCGGKYSRDVLSNCFHPEIKLLARTIHLMEGIGPGSIRVNLTVPPSVLCTKTTGPNCEVRIYTTLAQNSRDIKCSTGTPKVLPQLVFLPQFSGARVHSCGASFVEANWKQTLAIQVKATIDGVYDHNQIRQIHVTASIIGKVTLRPEIALGNVQATVIDVDKPAICSSTGDPHIHTFDGQRYNNYLEGELVMYRHLTRPYEVRAILKRCSSRRSRPTCNCGVAIKVGDDVITLSRCQAITVSDPHRDPHDHHHHHDPHHDPHHKYSPSMSLQLYKNGDLTSGTVVRRLGCGQKYEVILPIGTKITVQAVSTSFVNFWITPSAADHGTNVIEGLCGTYNGNRRDDFTGPMKGTTHGISYSKYLRSSQPDLYIKVWMERESIFSGVAKSRDHDKQQYCNCFDAKHGTCGLGYDIAHCRTVSKYDITLELVKQARLPRLTNRRKRAAVPDVPTSAVTIPTPEAESNCSNSARKIEDARHFCGEYLNKSTSAMECGNLINLNINHRLEDCATDLQCTDSEDYARSMIDDIISHCVEEDQRRVPQDNETASNSTQQSQHLKQLVQNVCVEKCENGGECLQGVCACAVGYSGVDCSKSKESTTPVVDPLPSSDEPCDTQGDGCDVAPVTGDDFIESDDLKCELTYIDVKGTVTDSKTKKLVNATYMDISRVNCPLPETRSVKVKVTNDGKTYSTLSYLHVVYDSKCDDCRLDIAQISGSCKRKMDVCRIGGHCYVPGDINPHDICELCDTTTSKIQWTRSTEVKCTVTTSSRVSGVTAPSRVSGVSGVTAPSRVSGVTAPSRGESEGIGTTAKIVIGVVCGVAGLCSIFVAVYIWKLRSRAARQLSQLIDAQLPRTVELHREKTDMIKPMIYTNQTYDDMKL